MGRGLGGQVISGGSEGGSIERGGAQQKIVLCVDRPSAFCMHAQKSCGACELKSRSTRHAPMATSHVTTFAEVARFGRLYTGGKVQASPDNAFLVCLCGAEVNVIDVASGTVALTVPSAADEFSAYALRPDGRELVTAGHSRQFRSWDLDVTARTCDCARVWKGHKMPVLDLAYDGSGGLVASASADASAMVFDVDKGACTHVFRGHEGVLHLVAFHPVQSDDQILLLTAAADNAIRVWDLLSRSCRAVLTSHVGQPTALTFSADGLTMLSAGRDQLVNVWRCGDWKLQSSIAVLEPLEGIVVTTEGHFVTAGESGRLRAWEASSGKCVRQEAVPVASGGAGGAVADRPGLSGLLACGSGSVLAVTTDHNLVFHDASSLQPRRCLAGNNDEITDIKCVRRTGAASAEGSEAEEATSQLAVATNSEQIKLFDASAGMACALLTGHTDVVLSLDVRDDAQLIGSASKDGTARLWDAADGRCRAVCEGHVEAVGAIAFARKAPWLLTGSKDKSMKMWDIAELIDTSNVPNAPKPSKRAKTASASSERPGVVRPKARSSAVGHAKEINALAVAPNDKLAVSASQDRTLRVWSLKDGGLHELGVLKGHKRAVWCVAFSPVDRAVASGSGDMLIKLWSMSDYSCLRTLEGHVSSVLRVHWVSAGQQILSSGSDGLIKLWSAKTSECVTTLDAHEDKVWALAVAESASSGALEVWSGSADSVLVRWRDRTEEAAHESSAARDLAMQQEQDLAIAVHAKQFDAALALAMRLRQPRALRNVVEKLVETPEGTAQLHAAAAVMELPDLAHCLACARDWNTTATHSLTAQKLLHAVLKTTPASRLAGVPKLGELLDGLTQYTERHFERLDRLLQGSKFLGYTLSAMRMLEAPSADASPP